MLTSALCQGDKTICPVKSCLEGWGGWRGGAALFSSLHSCPFQPQHDCKQRKRFLHTGSPHFPHDQPPVTGGESILPVVPPPSVYFCASISLHTRSQPRREAETECAYATAMFKMFAIISMVTDSLSKRSRGGVQVPWRGNT